MTARGLGTPHRKTNRRKLDREAFALLKAFRARLPMRKAVEELHVSEDILLEAMSDGLLREDTAQRIERVLLARGAA